jgi:hypothetical protein
LLVAVGAAEVVVAGRAEEEEVVVVVAGRPPQAVHLLWAEAWEHDPQAVLALARARAAQCVRERALVAHDREPARADQAETLPRAPAPLPAN